MNSVDIVTQEDVARHAGVSRSVVSYVLNNGPRQVSDDTRVRVLEAIKTLGYRPNKHAQRLKMGSDAARNSIGILIGGQSYNLLDRPYYNAILSTLFDSAHQFDQHIHFFSFFDALKDPVFFNKNIHPDEISALILILPSFMIKNGEDEALFQQVVERVENIICLEEAIFDLPAVVFDRASASQTAVDHLIGLGHRRIIFLAIDDMRLMGYQQALFKHRIPYDNALVHLFDPTRPMQASYDIITSLIDSATDATAIFAANDESAIGAIAALKDKGLNVPEDFAVVSIDNIEMARMVRPALTTIDVPKQKLVTYAMQLLISQRNVTNLEAASIVLPTKLIVRESCGANVR